MVSARFFSALIACPFFTSARIPVQQTCPLLGLVDSPKSCQITQQIQLISNQLILSKENLYSVFKLTIDTVSLARQQKSPCQSRKANRSKRKIYKNMKHLIMIIFIESLFFDEN